MNIYDLEVGDIVWAKRYKSRAEKDKIPFGHQTGPYIVIRRTPHRVFALMCTSKKHANNQYLKVKINSISENKNTTYVYTGRIEIINKRNFLKRIGKVSEEELNKINKNVYMVIRTIYKTKTKHLYLKDLKFSIAPGDVILYKKKTYFIYQINNKKVIGYPINLATRAIDYENKKEIDEVSYYKFTAIFPDKTKVLLFEKIRKKTTPSVGKIIKYRSKLYYIYDFQDNYFYTFLVQTKQTNTSFKIANKTYYTNLKVKKIFEYNNICVMKEATRQEMKYIDDNISLKLSILKRGQVIIYNNNLYFIYGEEGKYFLCYRIYEKELVEGRHYTIQLANKEYETSFDTKKITKNKDMKILYKTNEKEVQMIKEKRKSIKKNKPKHNNECFNCFLPRAIIENKITQERVVILKREKQFITIKNLENGKFYSQELSKRENYLIVGHIDNASYKHYCMQLKYLNNIEIIT